MEIVPTGAALGADIWGVDLGNLGDGSFAEIHQAWLDHNGVLRFPCQRLDDDGFLAFATRFGQLDMAPINANGEYWKPEYPQLAVISNVVMDGKPVGSLGSYESKWHTDMSYNELPPKASMLYAIELPREGGDTGFASTSAAYDALNDDMKGKLAGLTCKHDSSHNSVGQVRKGFKEEYARWEDIPGAGHPLVAVHPETGRKALYVNSAHTVSFVGMTAAESKPLIDYLITHAVRPEFTCSFRWEVGTLAIWDNRCVQHFAINDYHGERRRVHRATITGDRPH